MLIKNFHNDSAPQETPDSQAEELRWGRPGQVVSMNSPRKWQGQMLSFSGLMRVLSKLILCLQTPLHEHMFYYLPRESSQNAFGLLKKQKFRNEKKEIF